MGETIHLEITIDTKQVGDSMARLIISPLETLDEAYLPTRICATFAKVKLLDKLINKMKHKYFSFRLPFCGSIFIGQP